jgi:hypothetical protein
MREHNFGIRRAGPDAPEFGDVLVRVIERGVVPEEPFKRTIYSLVIGIVTSRNPKQNIRVDQVRITHLKRN